MNKHLIVGLIVLMCSAFVSAGYGIFYMDNKRAFGLEVGNSYVESVYPTTYQSAYTYPSYYLPTNYASPYDAYPYSGPSSVLLAPNYAGYGTGSYGKTTYSRVKSNCYGLSLNQLSGTEVLVPRGSAGEATLFLSNRSGTTFTINGVNVRDSVDIRAPSGHPSNSVIKNRNGTTISVPISAAFDTQADFAGLNVEVTGTDIYGNRCTVQGSIKATVGGDGSFNSYDRRTIVYRNGVRGRDYGDSYSTATSVIHLGKEDP